NAHPRLEMAGRRLEERLLQPRSSLRHARARQSPHAARAGRDGSAELALRFILEHRAVSTTIPGMRRPKHVERNLGASDGVRLPPRLHDALRTHRWNRVPNATP